MVKVDTDKNNEKLDDIPREISRINKAIRMRRRKSRQHREISLSINELNNSKTETEKKIDAIKQINSHIEEVKNLVKIKTKEIKKKKTNLPNENPFQFKD